MGFTLRLHHVAVAAARSAVVGCRHRKFFPRMGAMHAPVSVTGAAVLVLLALSSSAVRVAAEGVNDIGSPPPVNFGGPVLNFWNPTQTGIAYLFHGQLERSGDAGAPPFTVLTVGAQINAKNGAGVHQGAFGIATEAWAQPESFSMLTGIEATVINQERDNPWRKISFWSTFKNRPDTEYFTVPTDPMNMGTQALRIESQEGTGFERGVVFAPISLHKSRNLVRPVAIDFAEVPLGDLQAVDIMRFPDGCALVYLGQGRLGTRCD